MMLESLGKLPRKIQEKSVDFFVNRIAPEVVRQFREGGWKNVRDNIVVKQLQITGVKPEFIEENEPGFAESRHRLNTEPGVIICNHPNTGEVFIILSTLEREDLKVIVAHEELYKHLPADIAQKYFFSAAKDFKTMRAFIEGADEHIKSGGVLLIFPQLSSSVHFERGFRALLQKLKPEDMVYCFNVNTSDAANFSKTRRMAGLGSELFIHPVTNINQLGEPSTIRTAENYTQAGEWQSVITGVPKGEADLVLTKKYERMFASNK